MLEFWVIVAKVSLVWKLMHLFLNSANVEIPSEKCNHVSVILHF